MDCTLDISAAATSEEAAASRPCLCYWNTWAGIPQYLLLLFLVHVFVSVYGVRRPYTCWCVCRVSSRHRVCQHSQRNVHGARLRVHNVDVLVYDISVSTCCGIFSASVALSQWALRGPSLLDWSDTEYAFLFWKQWGVPCQFRMSPGMRWYTTVGLHTMQGISGKLRELTHYDHGASAVNQARHGVQDAL